MLTTGTDPGGTRDASPAWSPDGSLIAFSRWARNGRPQLYVIKPNGRGLKHLRPSQGNNPSWSPDSRRLAFDDGSRIAIVALNGTTLKYLTRGPDDSDPAWSPDGRKIAFVRTESIGGNRLRDDLWMMDSNGRNARRLAKDARQPAWRR